MDIQNLKALVKILTENNLTCLEVSESNLSIRIEKQAHPAMQPAVFAPAISAEIEVAEPQAQDDNGKLVDFNKLVEVKSPLVGVFHAAPSPDSVPFVSIGNRVEKGDVLCIVEAMKLMNEITAETDGEIVDICVKEGDIAEYGQVLFKMF